jgi:hypothetical protein
MKTQIKIVILAILALTVQGYSQQAVPAAGGTVTGAAGSFSFTVGQAASGYFKNSSNSMTVGVQQTYASYTTQVQAAQCATVLANLDTAILADTIVGAQKYRFEVSNGNAIRTIESVTNSFTLAQLDGGACFNTVYAIRVAVQYGGIWYDYGTSCTVTTPNLAPTATPQVFCAYATVANLVATGNDIKWYASANEGAALATTTALTSGTYYASQTVNGCESTRTPVTVSINDAQITASANLVCVGTAVTITASSTSATSNGTSTLPANLQNGLVGYWPFNGNANDASGNNNDGTVNGATLTTDRFGNSNGAYSFDGNDFIETNRLNFNSFTSSLWLNLTSFNCYSSLIDAYPSSWEFLSDCITPNISAVVWNNDSNYEVYPSNYAIPINTWINLALTFENNEVKIYANGIFVMSTSTVSLNNLNGLYYFGRSRSGTDQYLNGKLDDIAIYNRALSPSEISQLYNQGQTSYLWSTGETTATINPAPTTTTTYWCDVTVNGVTCRKEVTITVNANSAPTAATQTFCGDVTVANLVASGSTIIWYASENEVAALPTSTTLATGTYYDSQTVNGCESPRTEVAVSVNDPQITASANTVCSGTPVNLTVNSSSSPSNSNSIINYSRIIGNELYVSPNGIDTPSNGNLNSPFKTIQYAINNAQNNQIITLKNGIYYGVGNRNINLLGKKLIIQSENGPYATIMDCQQSERGFNINQGETNETIIQGITIKNGKTFSSPIGYGSAVFVEDNSSITIKNCLFESNLESTLQFGDTEVAGGQSFVTNCVFRNNLKSQVNSSKKTVTVENCLFENNISLPGEICGNGHASYPPSYYKNCIFRNNQADIIVGLGHAKSLVNCLLYNNTTTYGTVYMGTCWSGINIVNHCTFYNNTCNYYDSHWYDHIGQVYNSIFSGPNSNARNHVSGNQGAISYFSSREGDPSFIDASNGNFNLALSSNCIANANDGQNIGVDLLHLPNFNTNVTYSWSTGETTATINPNPTETTTYWCDVTINGVTCRKEITIDVTPKTVPTFVASAAVCSGSVLDALPTTSINGFTGTWSPAVNNLATTDYTFIPTAGQCVATAMQTIEVITIPAPTATSQTFCGSTTVANLVASGSNIKWYASANNVAALPTSTALATGTYYASQTANGCESTRTAVEVYIIDAQITTSASTVCENTNVTLSATTSFGISTTISETTTAENGNEMYVDNIRSVVVGTNNKDQK